MATNDCSFPVSTAVNTASVNSTYVQYRISRSTGLSLSCSNSASQAVPKSTSRYHVPGVLRCTRLRQPCLRNRGSIRRRKRHYKSRSHFPITAATCRQRATDVHFDVMSSTVESLVRYSHSIGHQRTEAISTSATCKSIEMTRADR